MYLNLTQVAESLGVSEKVVADWMRDEGLPHTPDRGRFLFDRAAVAHWAAVHGLAAKVGFLAPETSVLSNGWRFEPLLRSGGIRRDVPATGVLKELCQIVTSLPGATPAIGQFLAGRLATNNGLSWAPIGGGFALPHLLPRVALGRDSGTIALLLLQDALTAEPAPDEVPITRLFFFVAPSPRAHLDLVGRLCRLLLRGPLRELIVRAAPDEEIFRAFAAADKLGNGGTGKGEMT